MDSLADLLLRWVSIPKGILGRLSPPPAGEEPDAIPYNEVADALNASGAMCISRRTGASARSDMLESASKENSIAKAVGCFGNARRGFFCAWSSCAER